MERVEVTGAANMRSYERYGWMILTATTLLSAAAAIMTTLPPISWFWNPLYTTAYSIMGALGVSWVGFNIFALAIILIPFRRGERWAWYALWLVPLLWLAMFTLAPDLIVNALLAALAAAGLILPFRRFFPGTQQEAPRVK